MDQSPQRSAGETRERVQVCSAPHPLLGLGVTVILIGTIGSLVYLLVR